MLTMNDDVASALEEYLRLLEQGSYFLAHEVLEEAWHPLRLRKDPLANLLKGLINAAIAFEHIKRSKSNAKEKAHRVIASYERHKHLCVESLEDFVLYSKAIDKIEALKKLMF